MTGESAAEKDNDSTSPTFYGLTAPSLPPSCDEETPPQIAPRPFLARLPFHHSSCVSAIYSILRVFGIKIITMPEIEALDDEVHKFFLFYTVNNFLNCW